MGERKQGDRMRFTWKEWVDLAGTKHRGGKAWAGEPGPVQYGIPMVEALAMARGDGYQAALPAAERFAERVETEVQLLTEQNTFASTYDVCGGEVDMGRFLAGEPECMLTSVPLKIAKQGRAVRLAVPGSYNGGTSARSVEQRGAAIMALAQILARAQHPLEVWVGFSNMGIYARHTYMVLVQAADQPLDEGRLMYALAHLTSNRRLCFSAKEQLPGFSDLGQGYGSAPRYLELDDLPDDQANTIIVEDFDVRPHWDEDAAIRWITETLERIGLAG